MSVELNTEKLWNVVSEQTKEIAALHIVISEYKILLAASVKREGELMGAIREHKKDNAGWTECDHDVKLWKVVK